MTEEEYWYLLKKRHAETDWDNLNSIRAYNEYARDLRCQMAAEREHKKVAKKMENNPENT